MIFIHDRRRHPGREEREGVEKEGAGEKVVAGLMCLFLECEKYLFSYEYYINIFIINNKIIF